MSLLFTCYFDLGHCIPFPSLFVFSWDLYLLRGVFVATACFVHPNFVQPDDVKLLSFDCALIEADLFASASDKLDNPSGFTMNQTIEEGFVK